MQTQCVIIILKEEEKKNKENEILRTQKLKKKL